MLNEPKFYVAQTIHECDNGWKFLLQDGENNIGEEKFTWPYFLTDGVYTENSKINVKTMQIDYENRKLFHGVVEGVRECIGRVFAVLFKSFGIFNISARIWCTEEINFKACTITQNM